MDSRKVNNRVIESLIKSGSFDSLGFKRSQLMEILPKAMEQAKAFQRDRQSGQMSLFSVTPNDSGPELSEILVSDIKEWDQRDKLMFEKETVGFYITGHPLDGAIDELNTITDSDIAGLASLGEGTGIRIGGLIRGCKQLKSKRGEPMAFLTVEDIMNTVEVMVFPDTFSSCYQLLSSPDPIIVGGTVQQSERGPKIIAEEITLLPEAREKYTSSVHARLDAGSVNRQKMEQFKQLLFNYHGGCPLSVTILFENQGEVDIEINRDLTVRPCREMSERTEEIFGYNPLIFNKKPFEGKQKKKWSN